MPFDIVQAEDDAVRDTLQKVASEMDAELGCVVSRWLQLYKALVTHVPKAYGVPESHPGVWRFGWCSSQWRRMLYRHCQRHPWTRHSASRACKPCLRAVRMMNLPKTPFAQEMGYAYAPPPLYPAHPEDAAGIPTISQQGGRSVSECNWKAM